MPNSAAGTELNRLLSGAIDMKRVHEFLDGLDHFTRVEAVREVGGGPQQRLFAAADRYMPVTVDDVVPPSCKPLQQVRHYGKNSLAVFTFFEKRFCRPHPQSGAPPTELWGYNFQAMSAFTGPGYFVAYNDPNGLEVLIDYTRVPPGRPASWPPVKPNTSGLGRLVYGGMIDRLRRVSTHVTIGSAEIGGRERGNWFLLVREI